MSVIRKLHIFINRKEEQPAEQTTTAPYGSYSIDIQAGEDWIVTGKYLDNSLCTLELKRVPQTETKE